MPATAWETECSMNVEATSQFVWEFMSNVSNWNDPPAEFHLDGPFVTGARGSTQFPGQPAQPWVLTEVRPMQSYTLRLALNQAFLTFTWTIAAADGGTRMTQLVALSGTNASEYLQQTREVFSANLEPGMRRIALAIDQAFSEKPA